MRVGLGYDVHCFSEARPLILGGVEIPYNRGLSGHSDADVLLHAICDALLGAAGQGDIGQHFPDSDPEIKGCSSLLFLKKTGEILSRAGFKEIINIDSTVICQEPKISPYIEKMKGAISETLEISADKINIKGTTTEGLGFEGKKEGISAMAIVLIG